MNRTVATLAAVALAIAGLGSCIHIQRPNLIQIVPDEGQVGTEVTILGTHFVDDFSQTKVTFAGLLTSSSYIVSITSDEIHLRVPSGAVSGDVVVSVGGVESGRAPFHVLGPWLLTGTHDADGVTVLDTHTGLVESVVPMSGPPVAGLFSGDGSLAWLIGDDTAGGFAQRFEPTDRTVGSRVALAPHPVSLSFDSIPPEVEGLPTDRTEVWVSHADSGTIEIVESSTPAVRATIDAGSPVSGVELSIDGKTGFALEPDVPAVLLYDATLTQPTVLTSLPLGPNPGPLLYDELVNRAFVLERADAKVAFVDPTTKTITHEIPIGPDPIAMVRSGNTLYVLSRTNHTVDMVDGNGATVLGSIPVATDAVTLDVLTTSTESLVWVVASSGSLHGYDQVAKTETTSFGVDPNVVAFRTLAGVTGNFLFLAQDLNGGELTIVDRPATRLRKTALPGHPTMFVLQPGT